MSEVRGYCIDCGDYFTITGISDTEISNINQCPTCLGTNIKDITLISSDNCHKPASKYDIEAGNNEVYYSTDVQKLVYKDESGVVHELYT